MDREILRYDILKELFNIGVGKAASMLSEIINRKILLDVPDIKIFNSQENDLKIDDYIPKVLSGTVMISSICFQENLTGKANLIFPADKMRTFINLCLNDAEQITYGDSFTDIDFDIIKEIGNIILNALLGEISNFFVFNLNYSAPKIKIFDNKKFKDNFKNKEHQGTLILFITFIIDNTEIEGAIIVDLTMSSLNDLINKINQIEDELYE